MVKKLFILLLVSPSAWAMLKLNLLLQKTNNTEQKRVKPGSLPQQDKQKELKRYTRNKQKIEKIKKQRKINRNLARKIQQQKKGL